MAWTNGAAPISKDSNCVVLMSVIAAPSAGKVDLLPQKLLHRRGFSATPSRKSKNVRDTAFDVNRVGLDLRRGGLS